MSPDKINELIPVAHEMFKNMGDWDGLPDDKDGTLPTSPFSSDGNNLIEHRNAYLAQKLDEITYHIVMAMRARSEGRRADFSNPFLLEHWDKRSNAQPHIAAFNALYKSCIRGTYEHHLAKSLLSTLDLMGFYGGVPNMNTYMIRRATESTPVFRTILCRLNTNYEAASENIKDGNILRLILRIAELDKIDLEWHVAALINYMEQSK